MIARLHLLMREVARQAGSSLVRLMWICLLVVRLWQASIAHRR